MPDLRVVPLDDAERLQQLDEHGDDLGLGALGSLRERLDDQVLAVAVHHQRRQAVALAVDHAVRLGSRRRRSAASAARARSGRAGSSGRAPRRARACASRISERADQNAKPSGSPRTSRHAHERPRRGPAVLHDVAPEDPGVPALQARLALAADDDRSLDVHRGASIRNLPALCDVTEGEEGSVPAAPEGSRRSDPRLPASGSLAGRRRAGTEHEARRAAPAVAPSR